MKDKLREYVLTKFNEEQTAEIVKKFDQELEDMKRAEEKILTKSQYKTACKSILDRIALYKAFLLYLDSDTAIDYCRENFYSMADGFRKFANFMTKGNTRANLFKKLFAKGLNSDVWDSEITEYNKDKFHFNMHRCLYNDLCNKYGCKELTPMFCAGDYYVFGEMEGLKFYRSQTLGEDGEMCDFHFDNTPKESKSNENA